MRIHRNKQKYRNKKNIVREREREREKAIYDGTPQLVLILRLVFHSSRQQTNKNKKRQKTKVNRIDI